MVLNSNLFCRSRKKYVEKIIRVDRNQKRIRTSMGNDDMNYNYRIGKFATPVDADDKNIRGLIRMIFYGDLASLCFQFQTLRYHSLSEHTNVFENPPRLWFEDIKFSFGNIWSDDLGEDSHYGFSFTYEVSHEFLF